MIKVAEYGDGYREKWSVFVDNAADSTISHRIGWLEVMRKGLGHEPKYLMALDGENIVGVLPMVKLTTFWKTSYMISLPWIDYGGVCSINSESEKLLFEKARLISDNEKAQFLELRSVEAGALNLPTLDNKVTFLLELGEDPDIIWKDFNAKLRNQIRKSQKSELTAEFGGEELLIDFYRIFSWKMRDLGTPVWGKRLFETIFEAFPDTARMILVKKDKRPVAGGLVLAFKDRLYVPSAAAYNSALRYCPNHALYWEVIKKGCEEGFKYFDFGRSRVGSGTYNFKQQWVPTPKRLNWQYYLARSDSMPSINPSNPKYRFLINLWRRLPLPVANYLGPKIIRNFP
jgi:FemAB-related protein (PEP-CTERM system-associated)